MASSSNQAINYTCYASHVNGNGDSMLIMSMSDGHLRATIGAYLKKLSKVTNDPSNLLDKLDPMSRILLGESYRKKLDSDKDQIPFLLARLNTYMSEAVYIRNMVDLIPMYQQAVGRSAQLPNLIDECDDPALESADPFSSEAVTVQKTYSNYRPSSQAEHDDLSA